VVLADAETSYDPDSDVWTPGPPIPASFTGNSPWTWTGQVLLAWGSGMHGEDGGVWSYNPATDAVNRVADPPIAFRQLPASVWTGDEWIIWGGYSPADSTDLADGAAYNPLTNKWRIIAAAPLTARRTHAVWTGSQMIVAAGASSGDPVTGSFVFANSDGAAYDPATDTWHRIRDGFAHPGFLPVWTGREMVMFAKAGAVIYDPSSDTWTDMCCSVENGGGGGGTPVWTGSQIILVGSTGASLGGQVFTPPG
jgi:hypothetical protein